MDPTCPAAWPSSQNLISKSRFNDFRTTLCYAPPQIVKLGLPQENEHSVRNPGGRTGLNILPRQRTAMVLGGPEITDTLVTLSPAPLSSSSSSTASPSSTSSLQSPAFPPAHVDNGLIEKLDLLPRLITPSQPKHEMKGQEEEEHHGRAPYLHVCLM